MLIITAHNGVTRIENLYGGVWLFADDQEALRFTRAWFSDDVREIGAIKKRLRFWRSR